MYIYSIKMSGMKTLVFYLILLRALLFTLPSHPAVAATGESIGIEDNLTTAHHHPYDADLIKETFRLTDIEPLSWKNDTGSIQGTAQKSAWQTVTYAYYGTANEKPEAWFYHHNISFIAHSFP